MKIKLDKVNNSDECDDILSKIKSANINRGDGRQDDD